MDAFCWMYITRKKLYLLILQGYVIVLYLDAEIGPQHSRTHLAVNPKRTGRRVGCRRRQIHSGRFREWKGVQRCRETSTDAASGVEEVMCTMKQAAACSGVWAVAACEGDAAASLVRLRRRRRARWRRQRRARALGGDDVLVRWLEELLGWLLRQFFPTITTCWAFWA
jgi:hypothetical protein